MRVSFTAIPYIYYVILLPSVANTYVICQGFSSKFNASIDKALSTSILGWRKEKRRKGHAR